MEKKSTLSYPPRSLCSSRRPTSGNAYEVTTEAGSYPCCFSSYRETQRTSLFIELELEWPSVDALKALEQWCSDAEGHE